MTGLWILVRKELREAWRSRRLPAVLVHVRGDRNPVAAHCTLPARDPQGRARRPADRADPDSDAGRCRAPAPEEPRPARGLRGDRPGDGRGSEREGARDGRVHPHEAGRPRSLPRRQAARARVRPRAGHAGRGRRGLDLHDDPVRARVRSAAGPVSRFSCGSGCAAGRRSRSSPRPSSTRPRPPR